MRSKVMNFICVLCRVNTVTFNDVTVDIDLSVYGKSSAEAMVGKRKQMSTERSMSTVTSLNVTVLTLLSTHIKFITSLISKFRNNKGNGSDHFIFYICRPCTMIRILKRPVKKTGMFYI
jgi:hypothetical protein